MFESIHGSSDDDSSPGHVTFHEIWSCASDLHSKDLGILYLSSQVLMIIHCLRPIIDVIVHSAGICRQSQVLYPQLSNHKSRHSSTLSPCQPQVWRPWMRALFCASVSQEILWPVEVCRKPLLGSCGIVESTCLYCLPYHSQFIVLVTVLMFWTLCCSMLLFVTIIMFLVFIALWYWHYCFCRSRARGRGRCAGHQVATAWQGKRMKLRGFASFRLRWDVRLCRNLYEVLR